MSRNARRSPLGWRFVVLVAGQGLSQIGNKFLTVGLLWFVLIRTQSRADLAWVASALALPSVLGLISGTWVDRSNRWHLMMGADAVRGILSLAMAWEAIHRAGAVSLLVLLGVGLQIAGSVFQPAEMAVLPSLVPPDQLGAANGINQMVTMVAQIVGLAAGGVVMALAGIPVLFAINAGTFMVSIATLFVIRPPAAPGPTRLTSFWADWREGMNTVRRQALLRRLIPIAVVINFALVPIMSLDAAWVRQVLHQNAWHYGLAGSGLMIGVVIGNGLYGALWRRVTPALLLPGALAGMAISVVTFANVPLFSVFLVCLVLFGVLAGAVNTMVLTLIQQYVPGSVLGRVAGTLMALTTMSLPVGMAAGAFFANHVALRWNFSGGALLALVGVGISWGLRTGLTPAPAVAEHREGAMPDTEEPGASRLMPPQSTVGNSG